MEKFEDVVYVEDVQFNVTGLYSRGRKPVEAYSHDDPAFSDPGESPQIEEINIYIGSQEVTEVITDVIKSKIYDCVLDNID